MSCNWLYLESRTTPERFCGKPGHPYCPEHQREMDAMAQADKDWDEILASLQAVDDAKREQPRICSVSAKRMYANEGEAKATAAHRIADKKTAPTQLRTYKCLHCGGMAPYQQEGMMQPLTCGTLPDATVASNPAHPLVA